jgi:polyhydroxybutyrate depolymerase
MQLETDLGWNSGGGFAPDCLSDDHAFVNAVVDDMIANYDIDTSRVYLVGMSNGGMLAYNVAARSSARFAAMASVCGVMTVPSWNPANTMPVLYIHGTADGFVPIAGGGPYPFISLAENMKRVCTHHGLPGMSTSTSIPATNPSDLSVQRFDYRAGSGVSNKVVHYEVAARGPHLAQTRHAFHHRSETWPQYL